MAKLTKKHNLQAINPRLAKQWHPTNNGSLTPKDVVPNSNKKFWWLCGRGHEWEATVGNRAKGRGCPYCAGRKVCDDNCLATLNPKLAKQWHPVKNDGLTPKDVTPGSNKKVWWMCNQGHEWKALVYSRNTGVRCPRCWRREKIH